jgi:Cu2+-exporting ATPase
LRELGARERRALFTLVEDNAHPIARCLHEQLLASGAAEPLPGTVIEEIGQGVAISADGVEWRLGRAEWALSAAHRSAHPFVDEQTMAESFLARDGEPVAIFQFEESARSDAVAELASLQKRNLNVYVLSGDRRHKVERLVAGLRLPAGSAVAEMSPHEKAEWITNNGSDEVMMLGDGANDSLAFDRALCRGTPVVHRGVLAEKADFYYLGRGIEGIRALFEVNDCRLRTHRALMIFSISYNAVAVGLAIAGTMNPLLAAILMPGSSLASLAIVGLGMQAAAGKVK